MSTDIKWLRNWLRMPTRQTPVYSKPQPEINPVQIEVDFRETDGAKLHFYYPDGCSLCIQLNADGTWTTTVGQ